MRYVLEEAPGNQKLGLELAAGVGKGVLNAWLHGLSHDAKISTVRCLLNALGKDLAIVDLDECDDEPSPLSPYEDRRRALRMAEDGERFARRMGL